MKIDDLSETEQLKKQLEEAKREAQKWKSQCSSLKGVEETVRNVIKTEVEKIPGLFVFCETSHAF